MNAITSASFFGAPQKRMDQVKADVARITTDNVGPQDPGDPASDESGDVTHGEAVRPAGSKVALK